MHPDTHLGTSVACAVPPSSHWALCLSKINVCILMYLPLLLEGDTGRALLTLFYTTTT